MQRFSNGECRVWNCLVATAPLSQPQCIVNGLDLDQFLNWIIGSAGLRDPNFKWQPASDDQVGGKSNPLQTNGHSTALYPNNQNYLRFA